MNSCEKYKKWVFLFSLNELEGDEKDELEAHLEKCSFCQKELQKHGRFLADMKNRSALEPTSELQDRIALKIAAGKEIKTERFFMGQFYREGGDFTQAFWSTGGSGCFSDPWNCPGTVLLPQLSGGPRGK